MTVKRLVLISTIPNGYARREFGGIQYCLNHVNPDFCVIVEPDCEEFKMDPDDFYIVADYYFNPTFKTENMHYSVAKLISRLPAERTAIYYSDPLFKFEQPELFSNWKYIVFFSLANYRKTTIDEYKDCRLWENVDINEKDVIDIPISELAFWSYIKMNEEAGNKRFDFKQAERDYDISYIINSKILARQKLLNVTDGLLCQFGNFPAIDNINISRYVKNNPNDKWENQKVFGLNYLNIQNGLFTLVMDDDKPIKVAWPMRFYECMVKGIIPILHEAKDCEVVYKDFYQLKTLVFSDFRSLRRRIKYFKPKREHNKLRTEARLFMNKYVYDAKCLYDKTIQAIEEKVKEN